jgi:hypothetical protein
LESSLELLLLLDELLQEGPPKPIYIKWNKREERRGDGGGKNARIFPTLYLIFLLSKVRGSREE